VVLQSVTQRLTSFDFPERSIPTASSVMGLSLRSGDDAPGEPELASEPRTPRIVPSRVPSAAVSGRGR